MHHQSNQSRNMFYLNGWLALGMMVIATVLAIVAMVSGTLVASPVLGIVLLLISGFRIVQPNTALVSTCFGRYSGVLMESGLFWIVPIIYQTTRVSLRTNNYTTPTLKVNDASGTPIDVSAAIVYHIDNPAAAVLDVEDVHAFIQVQSESALRTLVSMHPYVAEQKEQESLSRHSDHIMQQFCDLVQERVLRAGIHVDEARFTHLAYSAEVAQAMLRKQQAEAVIAARHVLVRGAVDMVAGTVYELEKRQIVSMDSAEKARLVTNMMTVLLAEENTAPVLNVGGQ